MFKGKLVRDRIPEIISQQENRTPITCFLDSAAYREALEDKLAEETNEFLQSGHVEELVDILEVIYALAALGRISPAQLEEMRLGKREQRGGFDRRLFLVEVATEMLSADQLGQS